MFHGALPGRTHRRLRRVERVLAIGDALSSCRSPDEEMTALVSLDDADRQLLEAMCTQVATTLRKRQTLDALQTCRRREREFLDLIAAVPAGTDAEPLFGRLQHKASRIFDAECVLLYLLDPQRGDLWSRFAPGPGSGSSPTEIRRPRHGGIVGHVLSTGQSAIIRQTTVDARFDPRCDQPAGFVARSMLCLPIAGRDGRPSGVLQLLNKRGDIFAPEDEQRLRALAAHLSMVIDTARLVEEMHSMKSYTSAMARYIDPRLADQMRRPDGGACDGRSMMATILFADIRGFTGLAQRLGPQGTVDLLNEYFSVVVACLDRQGGMLDKFIGDAVMATFGVPLATGDDEDRSITAAIAMLRSVAGWNHTRSTAGLPTIEIGIGINSDVVVAGNIGSATRMDYTVIGDGVNLAARLQQACKLYHAPILISEHTRRRLRCRYRLRPVDTIRVRGRAEPVAVHEVLDHYTDADTGSPASPEVLRQYESGMRAYRDRRFTAALSAFSRAVALCPDDRLTALYVERCRSMLDDPPAAEWDGAWPAAAEVPL